MGAGTAYVGLGGNVGDVLATFRAAVDDLEARGIEVVDVASAYLTLAWLPPRSTIQSPDFWNTAVALRTTLEPVQLLELMQAIERAHGRVRRGHWWPRTLDLDMILFDDVVCKTPTLTLPHPGLYERPFVLQPMAELAPDVREPVHGKSMRELMAALRDPEAGVLEVRADWRRSS